MAVYTDVAADELADFLGQYDLGELLSYKGIAEGVENSNFLLHTTKGSFILTLYEKRVAKNDLPYFLALMTHLAGHGINCPLPVKAKDGEALRDLAGRPAAIITFLEGVWPRKPSATHCAGVGDALAKMHLAGANFAIKRANALSVSGWRPLFDAASHRADEVQPDLHAFLAAELDYLSSGIWPDKLPEGVIHADLFNDNVFFSATSSRDHRLHLRLQRHAGLRHCDLPQCLVLRAGSFLQRHQGARLPQCLWPRAQAD